MNDVPMKPRILSLLRFARQQEQQMVQGLSEAERKAQGTTDRWAAKDFLANNLLWRQLQTRKLAAALHGEVPPVWRDMEVIHQMNSQAFARNQERPIEEIEKEADHVFAEFLAQVEGMSEEELSDPHHYAWQEGEPLWGETLGNGLWHPCSQIRTFYLQNGRRQQALELQETMLRAVREAELPSENLGVVIYNQACFYASNGWTEKALLLLPEALQLRPTLIEWSRHDPDFDSLRSDPDFQAIFANPQLQAPVSQLISAQELHLAGTGERQPLVLDVRGATEYTSGHVRDAVNIPLGQLQKRLAEIPQDRPVVTYCNMHHRGESRGERAAALLRERGYQAQTLDGGYPRWLESGLPVG